MANKSVLSALDRCDTPSFGSQDDIQSTEAEGADERHLLHVELEPSLNTSLLALSYSSGTSHSDTIPTTTRVPAYSPSLAPSNLFPDTFGETFFGPSISSTPTFDLSLISDCSDCPDEEPEEFFSSDYTSISSDAIQTPENLPKGVGLGITGIWTHDGSRPFDGIGLVSIRRARNATHEPNVHLPESLSHLDEGDAEISDTFLREATMTFVQDPFHIHSLATIPECQSWSELDLDEGETEVSVDEIETSHALPVSDKVSISENEGPLGRVKKHFSASTISSELKRTSARRVCTGGMRTRSSTWPSYARIK